MKNETTTFETKLAAFAELVETQTFDNRIAEYGSADMEFWKRDCEVSVKSGPKYTRVDVGTSGKYMVVNETGEIFGIKAYGVIHRGHQYGTLDTVNNWYWGGYLGLRYPDSERAVDRQVGAARIGGAQ